MNLMPGDRVRVFDPRLYKDDVSTPSSETWQKATVIRRYGQRTYYPDIKYEDLIDVKFDYDGYESKGHFTQGAKPI